MWQWRRIGRIRTLAWLDGELVQYRRRCHLKAIPKQQFKSLWPYQRMGGVRWMCTWVRGGSNMAMDEQRSNSDPGVWFGGVYGTDLCTGFNATANTTINCIGMTSRGKTCTVWYCLC